MMLKQALFFTEIDI